MTWGADTQLVEVNMSSTCDCVTQALWQRNLAWNSQKIEEKDLMMISESDVLITTGKFMEPLKGNFRAWIFWAETSLYGSKSGSAFPPSSAFSQGKHSPWLSPRWQRKTGDCYWTGARLARRRWGSSPATPMWRPSGTGPRRLTAGTGSPTRTSSQQGFSN